MGCFSGWLKTPHFFMTGTCVNAVLGHRHGSPNIMRTSGERMMRIGDVLKASLAPDRALLARGGSGM